uniref:Phospholipase B-like n=1 Tax=Alexandrium monilatum TaxID=311494 RepID=A0A7S4QQ97_9DINO
MEQRRPSPWPWRAPPGRAAAALALAAATALPSAASEASDSSPSVQPMHPSAAKAIVADWKDSDLVEVHYGELLLAQWVLEHSPWNAYHSGLGFVNNRTQQKVLFDYTPVNTSSVMNMVLPEVRTQSWWRAMILGEAVFHYHDEAKTQFYQTWPPLYTSMVRVGFLNGSNFHYFVDWVVGEFAPKHSAFQPIEVSKAVNSSGVVTAVRSRMCHDFVTDALWVLYRGGAVFQVKDVIFRDHIIMYAKAMDTSAEKVSSRRAIRRRLRYLRLLHLYVEEIKEQFTAARNALIAGWRLGLQTYLHDQYEDYHVELVPPFLNYCYLPLAIPPEVHNPLGSMKLCALGMEANITNTSAPWPWGPLLAAEEALDRSEVLPSLALIVLTVLLVQGQRST